MEKETIIVAFYADSHGEGGALREQIIRTMKKGSHLNGNFLNQVEKKGKELKAKSYRMAILIPRVFGIGYPEFD